ncbi:MAG TPA: isoprenylcysteine carboxylmethyltransferase family protein [Candidatus Nanoarchaeia archaeon]|nr:isoprenylcysteine carboxylmethyltransferase family protein [Candidatus Nanoarchaeia archaeon]
MILEWLALVFLIVYVPIPVAWLVIHPLVGWWRKHPQLYKWVVIKWVVSAVFFFSIRAWVWSSQVPLRLLPVIGGVIALSFAVWLDRQRAKVFSYRQLVGLPEIAPDNHKPVLVTEGIYGRLRHPRYVSYIFSAWGIALITRFLSVYLAAVYLTVGLYIVMLLEERELKKRFGKVYDDYMKDVPRWWPRHG